jgi:hypothetical protein
MTSEQTTIWSRVFDAKYTGGSSSAGPDIFQIFLSILELIFGKQLIEFRRDIPGIFHTGQQNSNIRPLDQSLEFLALVFHGRMADRWQLSIQLASTQVLQLDLGCVERRTSCKSQYLREGRIPYLPRTRSPSLISSETVNFMPERPPITGHFCSEATARTTMAAMSSMLVNVSTGSWLFVTIADRASKFQGVCSGIIVEDV